jgi:hypothetical protein
MTLPHGVGLAIPERPTRVQAASARSKSGHGTVAPERGNEAAYLGATKSSTEMRRHISDSRRSRAVHPAPKSSASGPEACDIGAGCEQIVGRIMMRSPIISSRTDDRQRRAHVRVHPPLATAPTRTSGWRSLRTPPMAPPTVAAPAADPLPPSELLLAAASRTPTHACLPRLHMSPHATTSRPPPRL